MQNLFIIALSIYGGSLLIIGYAANRYNKTLTDYLIAGRRLSLLLAVPTVVATWFGAGSCMGVSGTVYKQGFYGVIPDPFGCALALLLAGLFFAVPFYRLKIITISDLLAKSYGASFERIATLFMIPFYIGTLASQMLAMGYLFHIVSGVDVQWGILLGSFIVLSYTVYGGMWAVTLTDFVQFGLVILGLCLILPICFKQTESASALMHQFLNEFSTLWPQGAIEWHWSSYLGRILLTGLGAIMGQDIIQRLVASKSEQVARTSAILGGILYLLLGFIPLLIGIAGREIYPNLEQPEQLIPLLAKQYLSPVLFTCFAIGLLAAIMSTADSYLLAGTSLLVNNVFLKKWPVEDERKKIKLLQYTNILFALIALLLAFSGSSIFDLMVHSGATLFVSILVPTCMALFCKSTHRTAAWSAFFGGLLVWLAYIIYHFTHLSTQHENILFSAAFFGAVGSLFAYGSGRAFSRLKRTCDTYVF